MSKYLVQLIVKKWEVLDLQRVYYHFILKIKHTYKQPSQPLGLDHNLHIQPHTVTLLGLM